MSEERATPFAKRSVQAQGQVASRNENGAEKAEGAHAPVRTCVGCQAATSNEELVRLVLGPDGEVVADLAGRAFGRGAWVHPDPNCLQAAVRRGLPRSFKVAITTTFPQLLQQLGVAAERRVRGLLQAALRTRSLVYGADSVSESWHRGSAELLVLARDAAAASKLSAVEQAREAECLVEWGNKADLGAALGRPDTALIAVLDVGLASAVSSALRIAGLVSPISGEQGNVDSSTEDR